MAQAQKQQHSIITGPSKFDLMQALFAGKQVSFTILCDYGIAELGIRSLCVGQEDGSFESWNISGDVWRASNPKDATWHRRITGYFSTKHRRGSLTPDEPFPA